MAGRIRPVTSIASSDFYLISSWYKEPEYTGQTMVFQQSAAPTKWTRNTTADDCALRIVNTTGGVTGGTTGFQTIYTSRSCTGTLAPSTVSAGAFTIDSNYIPSHSHNTTTSPGGSSIQMCSPAQVAIASGASYGQALTFGQPALGGGPGGSNGSHSHSGGTVAGGPVSGTINMAVKYVDVIIATKDPD